MATAFTVVAVLINPMLPAGKNIAARVTAAAALAPAALTGPAAGSWGGGGLDLFFRDSHDGQLDHQSFRPGSLATWSGAERLGGRLTSQPAVASWAPGRYDVFARGTDNALWHKWYAGGWSGWESLEGELSSPPAVASSGVGRLDVFIRGADNALWTKRYVSGSGWSGWTSLRGKLTSGPAAASWGSGRLDVFVRGADNALWTKSFSGSWSPWESLHGVLAGEPGAAAPAVNMLDVFVQGTDNALWTRRYTGGTSWSPWTSLGGVLTSSPAATVPGAGAVAVFVRGRDGHFYNRQRPAGLDWSPRWQLVDSALTFRRLGAWVDTLDYSALTPATAVADMQAHGVRTLYLGTARYNSASDILFPSEVAAWLAAAHAAGIRVVGWYVPDYANLTRDVRRTLAVASYVSPAGHRFDAIGIDIEYPLNVPDPDAWNQAVAVHLVRVRAGTARPIGAIAFPPVLMRGWPDPARWATFPWSTVGRYADSAVPMSYWTSFTPASRCTAGDPQYCAYRYTRDNVLLSRQLTGLPVHVIGGVGDTATVSQVADYVRAARETAAAGGSLYDYRTTQAAFWPYLEQFG
jgi:hypothetical protein